MESENELDTKKEKIFVNKPKLMISRNKKNNYKVVMKIENTKIFMEKILNFQLIKLIFEINKTNFECCLLEEEENGQEANLYLLVKPLFKDLGVLQRYISLHLTKKDNEYYGVSFPEYGKKHNTCKNAILSPIKEMTISSSFPTPHKMILTIQIIVQDDYEMNMVFEKILVNFLKNIYSQTITFIEKIGN